MSWDIFKELFAAIPNYADDFIKLVSGPKRYFNELLNRRELSLKRSLIFLAVSFLIVETLQLPLMKSEEAQHRIAASAVFTLLHAALGGFVLLAAWRIVGGKAPAQQMLSLYFYIWGVVDLLLAITYVTTRGSLRFFDPTLYDKFISASEGGDLHKLLEEVLQQDAATQARVFPVFVVFIAGAAVILAWIVTSWGAFRRLNQLSRLRSTFAGGIFGLLCVPVAIVMILICSALVGPGN